MLSTAISPTGEFATGAATRPASSAAPINLWLVDDNHRLRATLMEMLGRCEGINCTGAFASPNHVLSALASKVGPDVILLDMNLGEHNGLDAIRPIKSLSPATQVLMFTTFFDAECKTRALTSGASDFLLKSFPLEKIITSIREAWRKPVPHLKKLPKPAAVVGGGAEHRATSQSVARADAAPREAAPPRKHHLAWIKNCLDMIRAARN